MRILVTTQHPGDAVQRLSSVYEVDPGEYDELAPEELIRRLQNCDAAVAVLRDRFDRQTIFQLPNLRLIANVAVGFDNIDVAAATESAILVLNTPGVLTHTTADLAFSLLLATARRVVESDRFVRDGLWNEWKPDQLLGLDVHGKTLGIIGFGRIGQAVARRALAFNMKVIYSGRSAHQSDFQGADCVSLAELLSQSDFISLHTPLTKETHHLIGEQQLAQVKPTCILINTARGAVVDQQALISALLQRRIYGAGLDVFEDEPSVPEELKNMSQVVLLPHIGSATVETRAAMASLAADGLLKAFSGQKPDNVVNPEVWPRFLERIKSDSH